MASHVVSAEKRYRMSLLLDAYGDLLTPKQTRFLRRYYEQDYSFGEIAAEASVSRQAIFDSVKHGVSSLERYERVLGLVARGWAGRAADITASPGDIAPLSRAAERLRELSKHVALSSIDGDVRWITDELDAVGSELEALLEGSPAPRPRVTAGAASASTGAALSSSGRRIIKNNGPEVD